MSDHETPAWITALRAEGLTDDEVMAVGMFFVGEVERTATQNADGTYTHTFTPSLRAMAAAVDPRVEEYKALRRRLQDGVPPAKDFVV